MAKAELERTAEPSVLDRLIDTDRGSSADRPLTRAESVRRVMEGVRRDLELLLNSRRIPTPTREGMPELNSSMYYYGLPDINSVGRDVAAAQNRLARQLEEAITAFEPRLTDVKIAMVPTERSKFGELRFTVQAELLMDPTPERVTFDTLLDSGRGAVAVSGGADA
jgi:type VI secretion system protein ImpF